MDKIIEFFTSAWAWINDAFNNALNLEGFLGNLYMQYIFPIPSFLKTLLLVLGIIILILGIISFIKKTIKLFVVIAVIALVIIFLTNR